MKERLRLTVPPGLLVADDRLRLETWAKAGSQRQRMPQARTHETTEPRIPEVNIIRINRRKSASFGAARLEPAPRRGHYGNESTEPERNQCSLQESASLDTTEGYSTAVVWGRPTSSQKNSVSTCRADRLVECRVSLRRAYATLVPLCDFSPINRE